MKPRPELVCWVAAEAFMRKFEGQAEAFMRKIRNKAEAFMRG